MATPAAFHQHVTFTLMGEEYALQIDHVREIIECDRVTAVPSMPPVVRGVLNLRGAVVPVVDLPVKFGLAETDFGRRTYVVVVEVAWSGEAVRHGLLTTELGRVIDVKKGDIKPVPDFGTRIQSEYLRGVGQIEGRFVLFLATEHLLSAAELLRVTTLDVSQLGAAPPAAPTTGDQAGEV
jgi:purine-binding chemotaxis protein CheW